MDAFGNKEDIASILAIVPILRAGLGMVVDGMLLMIPARFLEQNKWVERKGHARLAVLLESFASLSSTTKA